MPQPDLDEIFADFEPGINLLTEVRRFYGTAFFIEERTDASGISSFNINDGGSSLIFQNATIKLNTTTSRLKAATMHELLHISLPMRGFSIINDFDFNSSHLNMIDYVNDVIGKLLNVVEHDIFIEEFLKSGLPLEQFQNQRAIFADYKKEASQHKGRKLIQGLEWRPWSWWSFEYLNNYISIEHGDDQASRLARDCQRWGAKALPGFNRTCLEIRNWVSAGRHKHPNTYRGAMNDLISLLHLPPIKAFSDLTPVSGAAPRVELVA